MTGLEGLLDTFDGLNITTPMNNALIELVVVLDRSGSMEAIRDDALGGFNAFVESQRAVPGDARLTLVLFDHTYDVVHDAVPLESVPALKRKTYVPRGTTALLDAMGRAIDDAGRRLAATPEPERPGKVIVAVLTDGMENASRRYTRAQVFDRVTHQRERYGWDFVFLAANQDAIATGTDLGMLADDAVGFAATPMGMRSAFDTMSAAVYARRTAPGRPNP